MNDSENATPSARAIAERVHKMVEGTDRVLFADLFAPDGVLEYPFQMPTMPQRIEGREAIRAFRANVSRVRELFTMEGCSVQIHDTTDPAVVIMEIEHHGTSHLTGKPYSLTAVGVMEVRDGLIVTYRDYMNPVAVAQLTGRVPQLIDALTASQGADANAV